PPKAIRHCIHCPGENQPVNAAGVGVHERKLAQLLRDAAPPLHGPDEETAIETPRDDQTAGELRAKLGWDRQPPFVVDGVLELTEEHQRLSTPSPTFPQTFPQGPTL